MYPDFGKTTTDGTTQPLATERLPRALEPLSQRIEAYLPSQAILAMQPSPVDRAHNEALQKRPADSWTLVYYEPEQRLVIVPTDHPINTINISSNLAVYGSGSMETFTEEPVLGEDASVVSGNIVLLEPRMDRLYGRALPNRKVDLPTERDAVSQGIKDLMAIQGTEVLTANNTPQIASIRLLAGPGVGSFGKRAIGQTPVIAVESYRAQRDFGPEARDGRGLTVTAGPEQRKEPFLGKHADHYGNAGNSADIGKDVGGADTLLFAEYDLRDPKRIVALDRITDPDELQQEMMNLALSDGLGAELMAIRQEKDGSQTLLLPPDSGPLDVKRLGGVTAQYVIDHMAPQMGIRTEIAPWSLQQIADGEIVGLFYAGNAARLAEITTVRLHDGHGTPLRDVPVGVPEIEQQLVDRFEAELAGQIPASDPSLLTPVDFAEGAKARAILENAYTQWFHPTSPEAPVTPQPARRGGWRRIFVRG